jgi:2-polyprenyl-6-methoxyphenol hydroxylase-like FAD-dependent oxidoreductase
VKRGEVLIVGAGIGGLSASIALRGQGFGVTILEIQPDLHSSVYGVGIIQPVNALRALDAIGCADECLRQGYASKGWARLLDAGGNLLHEIPGATIPGFPCMNGITRPKLHKILTDRAIDSGVTIEYGSTISDLRDEGHHVEVTCGDGSRRRADLVVGADGVRSVVRRFVLDAGLEPRYNGQSAFRVNIPREPEIDQIVLQAGPTGMAGFVPIGQDLAYLFLNVPWDRSRRPSPGELLAVLREKLAPFGGLTGRIRDTYIDDPAAIVFRPEEYLIAPAPWHRGRVVLLGDAVHSVTPHLGQGAAQAIEDGVVLAEELGASGPADADVADAFTRYAARRYERCKFIVEASVQIGDWEMHPSPDADQAGLTQRVMETMALPL